MAKAKVRSESKIAKNLSLLNYICNNQLDVVVYFPNCRRHIEKQYNHHMSE